MPVRRIIAAMALLLALAAPAHAFWNDGTCAGSSGHNGSGSTTIFSPSNFPTGGINAAGTYYYYVIKWRIRICWRAVTVRAMRQGA
jgi:hypothetical protein